MTNWTARIDALLEKRPIIPSPVPQDWNHGYHNILYGMYLEARLSLAAERLKEPHSYNCRVGYDVNLDRMIPCACGKDSDLQRILEGK